MTGDPDWEARRHAAECRYWLDAGFTSRPEVDALMARIGRHRSPSAVEKLRRGMREEWRRRQEATQAGFWGGSDGYGSDPLGDRPASAK